MKEKGFFQTLMSVCAGTESFPVLIQQPAIKTILNIVILAFLCAIFNVSIGLYPFYKTYMATCKQLEKKFGSIEFSEVGIIPKIEPEKQNCVINDKDFRIDYIPSVSDLKKFKPKLNYQTGIVWTPKSVLFWMRLLEDKEKLLIFPLLLPVSELYEPNKMRELIDKVQNTDATPSFYTLAEIYKVSANDFAQTNSSTFFNFTSNILFWIPLNIPTIYAVFLFSSILFNILFLSMMYLLFFTLFSFFLGRGGNFGLSFSEIWKASVYTAFPGFLIATVYTSLNLPFLNFLTIFLISYFVYYFAVFSKLKQVYTSNTDNKKL
jgi:hypothetical protein